MTHGTLTRTTALSLCLAMATPGVGLAQSENACTNSSAQVCENELEQSAISKVTASLVAGNTPIAGQIDQLNKGDLLKLIKERDLDIDPRGMPPAELRAAVKAELGIKGRADTRADEQSGGDADEDQDGTVQNLAQALSTAQEGQQAQAGAEAQGRADAEVQAQEDTEVQAQAETQAQASSLSTEIKELTRRDIGQMDRTSLLKVIRQRDLPIATQGMRTGELRNAVGRELGLTGIATTQRNQQEKATLGDALEQAVEGAVEGAVDDVEQSLDRDEAEREAERDRRRAEKEADADEPLAAAINAETEGESEVTTRTVTEETSRSSDEEFETRLMSGAEATTRAQVRQKDDNGLGALGQAVAAGLGALAINEILGANDEIVTSSNDRLVVRQDGELRLLKNDDTHLQRPGNEVRTRTYSDGSTRTVITRDDGTKVITIRAADGRVLRRVRERPDGSQVVILDDTQKDFEPVSVQNLPQPRERGTIYSGRDRTALEQALSAELAADIDRQFSLRQVRNIRAVRKLMPPVTLDAVNFRTDSAVIRPREAQDLAALGQEMAGLIDRNPDEVFLVEGHTDAVGRASYNLALSDRRAESVALALVEYFDVPPENLVIQGYGESDLAVPTQGPERANRRATVRRITPLLRYGR